MNFFEHQDRARFKTKWLVLLFCFGVALMLGCITFSTWWMAKTFFPLITASQLRWLLISVNGGTILLIGLGAWFKARSLSDGGISVALLCDGRLIDPSPADPLERRLRNIVEEMSIASGVPVPEIFVLDREEGINAFVAGYGLNDIALTVTAGTLKYLDRDELQGVIAHEFSHIVHGDTRLNMRMMCLLFGIFILSYAGKLITGNSPRRIPGRNNPFVFIFIFGLALRIIGSLGYLVGQLIQAAVSRQREFLADASAVQYTRNRDGILKALKKIGGSSGGSSLAHWNAPEVNHFLFSSGSSLSSFDSHPPLKNRIRALDPRFDGKFIPVQLDPVKITLTDVDQKRQARGKPVITPGAVQIIDRIGMMDDGNIAEAQKILSNIPEMLKGPMRDPTQAGALVYSLLLAKEDGTRRKQLLFLEEKVSAQIFKFTIEVRHELHRLPLSIRWSILKLCLPTLKQFSTAQYDELLKNCTALIEADGQLQLFEYCLFRTLKCAREPIDSSLHFTALKPLVPATVQLLSTLAHAGDSNTTTAKKAFETGLYSLRIPAQQMVAAKECRLKDFDLAISKIAQSLPALKERILAACIQTVLADRHVSPDEYQLLQTLSTLLHCPLPPAVEFSDVDERMKSA